ncbi:hypothetical protein SPFM15_00245 [Salmonella phage SPFM15]|nr:hypothetical protein SPFM5_00239 [Salmonella phage SPFM5]VFR13869.1 hypothetical protein SPFM15_00245 [Salmonella phage SPFM15]
MLIRYDKHRNGIFYAPAANNRISENLFKLRGQAFLDGFYAFVEAATSGTQAEKDAYNKLHHSFRERVKLITTMLDEAGNNAGPRKDPRTEGVVRDSASYSNDDQYLNSTSPKDCFLMTKKDTTTLV